MNKAYQITLQKTPLQYYDFMDKADFSAEQYKEIIGGNLCEGIVWLISKFKYNFTQYTLIWIAIVVILLLLGIVLTDSRCFRRWKARRRRCK